LHPDFLGSFLACACKAESCDTPAGDSAGSSCRMDLKRTKDATLNWHRPAQECAATDACHIGANAAPYAGRGAGERGRIEGNGAEGGGWTYSHSAWACCSDVTPAEILVCTRAWTMLLCDCAWRTSSTFIAIPLAGRVAGAGFTSGFRGCVKGSKLGSLCKYPRSELDIR